MTKLYVAFESEVESTEQDVVNAIVEGESCYSGISFEDLVEQIQEDNVPNKMDVYVFEIVDKGTIKTDHKFISSKKVKGQ